MTKTPTTETRSQLVKRKIAEQRKRERDEVASVVPVMLKNLRKSNSELKQKNIELTDKVKRLSEFILFNEHLSPEEVEAL